jgi:hypothetical protein
MMGNDDRRPEREAPEPGFVMRDADAEEAEGTDFSTFVLSLGTSALYHLGLAPGLERKSEGPLKQIDESDRLIARQTISTLEMIAEKTRGNLQPDEEKLLESILFEIRTRYVAVRK